MQFVIEWEGLNRSPARWPAQHYIRTARGPPAVYTNETED